MRSSSTQKRAASLLVLFILVLTTAPLTFADGTLDGTPGEQYGATILRDADNDATSCGSYDERADLMEFGAFSDPNSASATDDSWFFYFVIDSNTALNSGTAPTWLIPFDLGANNSSTFNFSGGGLAWRRNFETVADAFLGCYADGATSVKCELRETNGSTSNACLAGMTGTGCVPGSGTSASSPVFTHSGVIGAVNTSVTVLGPRTQIEIEVVGADTNLPVELRQNTQIKTFALSAANSDGGNVLDATGDPDDSSYTFGSCAGAFVNLSTLSGAASPEGGPVATTTNCKAGGRPTASGANDRQCTSLAARSASTTLTDIAACNATNAGVTIDGNAASSGDNYTKLLENIFAGPYVGGQTDKSDFSGESGAYQYWNGSSIVTNASNRADLKDVYVETDPYFLYITVAGDNLDRFGRSGGGSDQANLYIPIDLPDVSSSSAESVTTGTPGSTEFTNAPASRYVNFKGWDADYVAELIWHGNVGDTSGAAQLWDYTGGRSWGNLRQFKVESSFDTASYTRTSPPAATNLHMGRAQNSYEFAIPWAALGYTAWTGGNPPSCGTPPCMPAAGSTVKVGAYTTGDSNLLSSDAWDTYDQAPGIGQGCSGLGCHERVADEYDDTDDDRAGNEEDRSPYSGKTSGTSDRSSTQAGGSDIDTIESYYQMALATATMGCVPSGNPLAATLSEFGAVQQGQGILVSWETVSELNNLGFNLWRGTNPAAPDQQLNASLIPSQGPGSGQGFSYEWLDSANLVNNTTYYYWLEDVDISGQTTRHGPVSATYSAPTAVRLSGFDVAWSSGGATLLLCGAAGLLALAMRRRRHPA